MGDGIGERVHTADCTIPFDRHLDETRELGKVLCIGRAPKVPVRTSAYLDAVELDSGRQGSGPPIAADHGGKIGVGRLVDRQAEEPEFEMLHGISMAVVKIGADEVGLELVGVSPQLHGAVSHPVVDGGGLVPCQ